MIHSYAAQGLFTVECLKCILVIPGPSLGPDGDCVSLKSDCDFM